MLIKLQMSSRAARAEKRIERQFLRSLKIDRKAEAAARREERASVKAAKAAQKQARKDAIAAKREAARTNKINKFRAKFHENAAKLEEEVAVIRGMLDTNNYCQVPKLARKACTIFKKGETIMRRHEKGKTRASRVRLNRARSKLRGGAANVFRNTGASSGRSAEV